jgi:hypothetical protein
MVRLFDIENGRVVPTEHCYTINYLKVIMDNYPENYLKIYLYLFYMSCPNDDLNPYFNVPSDDKEEMILRDIDADFMTDDPPIKRALEGIQTLYDTPTWRAYRGISTMLDRLGRYMENTQIIHGRDGNMNSLLSAAKNYDAIRQSFKGAYKDLKEEQQSHVRGGAGLAYDQK